MQGIIAIHMVDYGPFEMEMYDGSKYLYPAAAQWTGRLVIDKDNIKMDGML